MEPITDKRSMYALLAAGRLGNTIAQFFDVAEWERSPDAARYEWWGVRTLVPGGPCRLNCPRAEVRATAGRPEFAAAGVNVSMMVDRACRVTLWAEVLDGPGGLVVYGIEYPPEGGSWRQHMPVSGRHWEGTAARMLLRRHMDPSSYDDMVALFEKWPGHVYEFSACDRELGTIPGRRCIGWELRGAY